ncbi:conjugal transfer protein TraD [Sphingomonas populi]|uniref:Conjugal transfer protein TraD n=1 Tax=Sphingomonas populi TaxID=2484750 RepID=A0A4Q6Y562_9SPHN|nr:conjugal transfer protein TraD [Sphingomonas populi]RZF64316.1 conjugal transfer protein TraD [Sphingomonas populi]
MRKPRDYDTELDSLDQKAKALKQRKIIQLGELVIACRADTVPVDVLAGALLSISSSDAPVQEAWRKAGSAMFQRKARSNERRATAPNTASASAAEGGTLPLDREPRTA